ncbi:MAG: OmpA family protein [Nannocystaceae bacterium]
MTWTRALLRTGITVTTLAVAPQAWAQAPAQPADAGSATSPAPAADAPAEAGTAEAGAPAESTGASAGGGVSLSPAGVSTTGDAKADKKAKKKSGRAKGKWGVGDQHKRPLFRYAPERNMVELGVFGGILIVSDDHDFYHPDTAPQKQLWRFGADIGLRAAYFPLSFLGVEAEFSANPTRVRIASDDPVFVYGLRGHAILQSPGTRITPFILGGYGMMGIASNDQLLGNDIDPVGHWGGGVKVFLNRYLALRLDARHLIGAHAARQGDSTGHVQVLAGLSFTLNRNKGTDDRDGDGFRDAVDRCPLTPGVEPDGCPARDLDGDGLFDHVDKCPCAPGPEPDGCPLDTDTDGDGFLDTVDKCPNEPGVAPDGCPVLDTDGDGFNDDVDTCPKLPETRNGFQDDDGCPDELPEEVEEFNGVIQGIFFDFGKATIKKESEVTLDKAAGVLRKFSTIKVEIAGHTDNVGDEAANQKLSEDRAAAVKQWLIDHGVEGDRVSTVGFGPSQPIDTNDTEAGRAKNRRIEFHVGAD